MSSIEKTTPETDDWVDNSCAMPSVYGYAEAASLLNDPCLHVDYQSLFSAAGASKGRAGEAGKRSLLNLNGQEHKRLRSEIAWGFRPRSVDRIRPFAQETAKALLNTLPRSQPFDFMRDFAKPYIEQTTGQYIGFSTEDIEALSKPLTAMAEAITDLHNRASEFDAAGTELLDYATEALMQRRSAPTDDVIGYIATKIESGAVDELFAANLVVTLLSAGLEPTILQMGILLQELSSLPDVWDEIASSPKRTPLVLEELLRLRSTNQGVVRCVYEDTEQHTMQFQKGTNVIVEIGKANHDPRRFPQPDEFNIQANKGAHLAFGFGPHHCLGAPLVRAQLQESLEVMAFILSCPRIIGVRSKTGQGLSGPLELTVEMESRTYPLGAEN